MTNQKRSLIRGEERWKSDSEDRLNTCHFEQNETAASVFLRLERSRFVVS
jgi:hypothetical protein